MWSSIGELFWCTFLQFTLGNPSYLYINQMIHALLSPPSHLESTEFTAASRVVGKVSDYFWDSRVRCLAVFASLPISPCFPYLSDSPFKAVYNFISLWLTVQEMKGHTSCSYYEFIRSLPATFKVQWPFGKPTAKSGIWYCQCDGVSSSPVQTGLITQVWQLDFLAIWNEY